MKYTAPFFDELYARGGFYDTIDSDTLSRPEEGTSVRCEGVLFSGGSYDRTAFEVLTSEPASRDNINAIFNSISASYQVYPPALIFDLKAAYAYQGALYQTIPGDEAELSILYTTSRVNDRPHVHDLTPRDLIEKRIRTYGADGRRVLYLSSAGSFNYGHWLVDDLPRLKLLIDDGHPTIIVVQSFPAMDQIRENSIRFLCRNRDVKVEFLPAEELAFAEHMTYVTPVSFHPYMKNPAAIGFLREACRQQVEASEGGRRIYVRRRAERGRILRNASPLEQYLKDRGFSVIDPERLSFAEQVEAFASASVIVGVMGAAMCNTLFSPPGTHVIYLAPDSWVEPFYWDLASVVGHSYHAVHGRRMFMNSAPHLDDFSIDTNLLAIALKRVLP